MITNKNTGKSNKGFTYKYSKGKKLPILKVQKSDNNCFDIKVKEKYKFIYIFYDLNRGWIIRFSNKYYMDN